MFLLVFVLQYTMGVICQVFAHVQNELHEQKWGNSSHLCIVDPHSSLSFIFQICDHNTVIHKPVNDKLTTSPKIAICNFTACTCYLPPFLINDSKCKILQLIEYESAQYKGIISLAYQNQKGSENKKENAHQKTQNGTHFSLQNLIVNNNNSEVQSSPPKIKSCLQKNSSVKFHLSGKRLCLVFKNLLLIKSSGELGLIEPCVFLVLVCGPDIGRGYWTMR